MQHCSGGSGSLQAIARYNVAYVLVGIGFDPLNQTFVPDSLLLFGNARCRPLLLVLYIRPPCRLCFRQHACIALLAVSQHVASTLPSRSKLVDRLRIGGGRGCWGGGAQLGRGKGA